MFEFYSSAREYKKKVNLEENEEEDTIVFNAVDTFIFNQEKSNGLTGQEEIIFPNVLLLVGIFYSIDF